MRAKASRRTRTLRTRPWPPTLSSQARQPGSFGPIVRRKSVLTSAAVASTCVSSSIVTPPFGQAKWAAACPVTTRSDSFGSKPGHLSAVSLLGVVAPPVQPAPKSERRRSAWVAFDWSAWRIRTVGASALAAPAQARASVAPSRRALAVTCGVVARDSYARLRLFAALGQVRAQPALDLLDRSLLARGVVLELVAPDPADGEVACLRVGEVEAADRRGRGHRVALGQVDPEPPRPQEVEQLALLAVVGAGRVAERRADAPEPLRDQVLAGEALLRRVPLPPGARLQPLREGLREPVGERLDDDRPVVVVLGGEARGQLVGALDRDRERPGVVARRRHVVGEAPVRPPVAVVCLLAQEAEARAVEHDVVALGVRRPEPVHPAGTERAVARDLVEDGAGVVVELPRLRPLEDRRELPLQVP